MVLVSVHIFIFGRKYVRLVQRQQVLKKHQRATDKARAIELVKNPIGGHGRSVGNYSGFFGGIMLGVVAMAAAAGIGQGSDNNGGQENSNRDSDQLDLSSGEGGLDTPRSPGGNSSGDRGGPRDSLSGDGIDSPRTSIPMDDLVAAKLAKKNKKRAGDEKESSGGEEDRRLSSIVSLDRMRRHHRQESAPGIESLSIAPPPPAHSPSISGSLVLDGGDSCGRSGDGGMDMTEMALLNLNGAAASPPLSPMAGGAGVPVLESPTNAAGQSLAALLLDT